MPNDFYGGVGVDLLYPSGLGINTYSEPEWSSAQIVSMPQQTSHESYQQHQASMPTTDYQDAYPTPDGTSRPPPIEVSSVPHHMLNIPRPKSSPSTFGPNVEDLLFSENPFKFKQDDFRGENYPSFSFPSPVPSGKSSPYFGAQPDYSSSARTSPSRHVPIAPDPLGMRQLQSMKRMREDEEYEQAYGRKRKRTASASGPVELNEEEQLLLKLKEEENLPWKDIATRFQTDLGKTYQVPALQMRFKRLRERMRSWTDADIKALEEAYGYWEKCQFDIISSKMLEFGASECWSSKHCARKWHELYPHGQRLVLHPHSGYAAAQWSDAPSFQQQPQYASVPSSADASPWQFLPDPWTSGHASPVDSVISNQHGLVGTPQQTPVPAYRSMTPQTVSRRSLTPQPSSAGLGSARQTPQPSATI
ncbi:MAG: hypothetical protein MMC23_003402 [Stictis urceolatum]|nr:hypothetical protein [Stictis urceolata]